MQLGIRKQLPRLTCQVKTIFHLLVYSILIAACASTQVAHPPATNTSMPLSIFVEDENKSAYSVWDVGDASQSDYPEFWEEYELAIKQGDAWVQDPLEVALHFLHPSMEASEPSCLKEEVSYLPTGDEGKAIFIFLYSTCLNDSVSQMKMRVELNQQDKLWKIDWFGGMKKCRRGSEELTNSWHTKICS